MKKFCSLLSLSVLVAGCGGSYIGKGPIELSDTTEQYFEEYLELPYPGFFAITEDGYAAYASRCDSSNCYTEPMASVVDSCRRHFERPCKIYADKKTVVWKFDEEPDAE